MTFLGYCNERSPLKKDFIGDVHMLNFESIRKIFNNNWI